MLVDLLILAAAQAAPPSLPFREAVRAGDTLYIAGQIGNRPGTLELVPGGLPAEAKQTMDNIGAILARNKLTFDDVVQCRVFLADIRQWADFNKVYATYFKPGRFPARSAFGANGLAIGAAIEVECIAHYSKPERTAE